MGAIHLNTKEKGNLEVINEPLGKVLVKYMSTSVAGMLGLSMCVFFDTMFIGHGIGDKALAALNICLPIYTIFNGIALLLGIGGATLVAIYKGQGKEKNINSIFSTAITIATILSLLIAIFGAIFLENIAVFLGANGELIPLVKDYIQVILICAIGFILTNTLNVFIRNDNAPRLSMWSTIAANLTNIVLDYVFIFPMNMGMRGAALATAISTITSLAFLMPHVIFKRGRLRYNINTFKIKWIRKILRNGLPSLITEISSGFVIFLFNIVIINISGDLAVSAYSIICNFTIIIVAIYNGIAQGLQPIVGVNYGAQKFQRVNRAVKIGKYISLLLGIVIFFLGFLAPEIIIGVFSTGGGELISITSLGISIYFIALIPMGINIINIVYFQCIEKSHIASVISTLRGIVLIIIVLGILTYFLGLVGVWMTVPIVEIIVLVIAMIIQFKVINI